MTTLYRVYTEYRDSLPGIVARHFHGATIIRAIGLWQGVTEDSAIIEIIGAPFDGAKILAMAEDIRATNEQSAVLVLKQSDRLTRYDVTAGNVAVSA